MECLILNARDAIRYGDRSEGGAIIERIPVNDRNVITNRNRSKSGTSSKSRPPKTCDAIGNGDGGERRAIFESSFSNACYWTIEGNDTLAVLVFVVYDICAKDIGFIWSDDIAIGRGIGDLPCRVNAIFHKLANILRPIRCLVCLLRATWDIGGG